MFLWAALEIHRFCKRVKSYSLCVLLNCLSLILKRHWSNIYLWFVIFEAKTKDCENSWQELNNYFLTNLISQYKITHIIIIVSAYWNVSDWILCYTRMVFLCLVATNYVFKNHLYEIPLIKLNSVLKYILRNLILNSELQHLNAFKTNLSVPQSQIYTFC